MYILKKKVKKKKEKPKTINLMDSKNNSSYGSSLFLTTQTNNNDKMLTNLSPVVVLNEEQRQSIWVIFCYNYLFSKKRLCRIEMNNFKLYKTIKNLRGGIYASIVYKQVSSKSSKTNENQIHQQTNGEKQLLLTAGNDKNIYVMDIMNHCKTIQILRGHPGYIYSLGVFTSNEVFSLFDYNNNDGNNNNNINNDVDTNTNIITTTTLIRKRGSNKKRQYIVSGGRYGEIFIWNTDHFNDRNNDNSSNHEMKGAKHRMLRNNEFTGIVRTLVVLQCKPCHHYNDNDNDNDNDNSINNDFSTNQIKVEEINTDTEVLKTYIISANDRNILIWDIETEKVVHVLTGHKHHIRSIQIVERFDDNNYNKYHEDDSIINGNRQKKEKNYSIISYSMIGDYVKVWDFYTGKELINNDGNSQYMNSSLANDDKINYLLPTIYSSTTENNHTNDNNQEKNNDNNNRKKKKLYICTSIEVAEDDKKKKRNNRPNLYSSSSSLPAFKMYDAYNGDLYKICTWNKEKINNINDNCSADSNASTTDVNVNVNNNNNNNNNNKIARGSYIHATSQYNTYYGNKTFLLATTMNNPNIYIFQPDGEYNHMVQKLEVKKNAKYSISNGYFNFISVLDDCIQVPTSSGNTDEDDDQYKNSLAVKAAISATCENYGNKKKMILSVYGDGTIYIWKTTVF